MSNLKRIRRRCDVAIRRIRYVDGIIDTIIGKIKGYFADLKMKLSKVGWGRKILFILGKLIKIASVASVGEDAVKLVKIKLEVNKAKNEVVDILRVVEGEQSANAFDENASRFANAMFFEKLKSRIIPNIFMLISALVGYAIEKASIPGKV